MIDEYKHWSEQPTRLQIERLVLKEAINNLELLIVSEFFCDSTNYGIRIAIDELQSMIDETDNCE